MNVVRKAFGLRHFTQLSAAAVPLKPAGGRAFTRTLWNMSRFSSDNHSSTFQSKKLLKPSINCACGCSGTLHIHTKGKLSSSGKGGSDKTGNAMCFGSGRCVVLHNLPIHAHGGTIKTKSELCVYFTSRFKRNLFL